MSSGVVPGWRSMNLSEVGSFSKGKGIAKQELLAAGFPCVRYAEIYTQHDIRIRQFRSFISKESANNSRRLRKNELVFAGSGETLEEIGKSVAFTDDFEAYVGGDAIVLTPHSEFDSVFLAYQLNHGSCRAQMSQIGQGSSVMHIYSSGLGQVAICIPPLPEQRKIAAILSSVDAVIEKTEALIAKLKDLKRAMMQELLTKGIGHTKFKDSPVGRIPAEWEVVRLGEVVRLVGGFAFKSEDFSDFGTPVIRISDLQEGRVDIAKSVRFSGSPPGNDFIVQANDMLVAMSGATTGKIAEYRLSRPAYVNQRVGKFLVRHPQRIMNSFLRVLIHGEGFTDKLLIDAVGGAQPNVSGGQIEAVPIGLPPAPEQEAIGKAIAAVDTAISRRKSILTKTESTKKALMQDLLTGKVRVNIGD